MVTCDLTLEQACGPLRGGRVASYSQLRGWESKQVRRRQHFHVDTLSSSPCSGVRHIQEIEPQVLSQILQFAFWMRKSGYRNSTVQTCVQALKGLARRTNLLDTESVKSYLANAELSENRKTKLLEDVPRFYAYLKIPFNRPRYKRIETLPFIPLESEIDLLIAGVGQKSAAFLQCIKETAARPGEAWSIKWTDIDLERACITIKPEKKSNPRQRKISGQHMTMPAAKGQLVAYGA